MGLIARLVIEQDAFDKQITRLNVAEIIDRCLQEKIKVSEVPELLSHLTKDTDEMLVTRMKNIVPEFTSMNSRFEALDQKLATNLFHFNFHRDSD